MKDDREIVEIFRDVLSQVNTDCELTLIRRDGFEEIIPCPPINYIFGNSDYIKEQLDVQSSHSGTEDLKYPFIALMSPFLEKRDSVKYFSRASLKLIIAWPTTEEYSNEERSIISFQNVLRPIYRRLLECLKEDSRLDFGYDNFVSHDYSENYSYGKYGAVTPSGQTVTQPIDAINISNLIITVKNKTCR